MDMENCEFREALQILGNITGTEIPGYTEDREKIEIKKNLYSLYKDATNYYKQALSKHPEIKKYLIDRGINESDIEKFHFGYSDSGVWLYNYLKDKWYEDILIEESQIFVNIKSRKDKFIGRVIFPIQNLRGDFVAFAGRITGYWEPKYINSPASQIYDKSSILYGLYEARSAITKKDRIILTEWYMDTIALHRAEFFETVAVSGTALTEKHIPIIKRLTHKVYICFDNDKAWIQATRNSLEVLKNQGLEVKIITISWAKDPDEYLEKWYDFETCIAEAFSPIGWILSTNSVDLTSIDEKQKFISLVLELIRSYSNDIEKDSYLKELSLFSDTPIHILYEQFKVPKRQKKIIPEQDSSKISINSEDSLIAFLASFPEKNKDIKEHLVFPETLKNLTQKFLENPENNISSLELSQKEFIKALTLKYEFFTEEEKNIELRRLTSTLNRNTYKSLLKNMD